MGDGVLTRIFMITTTTFVVVAAIVPFIKRIAIHIGALDIPNKRKIHSKPMPRLGGLAIYIGFLFGYMLFGEASSTMNSIFISTFIIMLIGIFDDIKPLKASIKFLCQTVAAIIIAVYGNLLIRDITMFGQYFNLGIFSYPVTIFFILGCTNCINLIDGLDGLAAGISAIYFATIGIISIIMGKAGLDFVLTFIMLGSVLGFLVHNFHPASIFAGDSGSLFMGLMIAIIALLGFKSVTLTSLIIPLLIFAIPILDTVFAIIRRLLKGEKISKPDKEHLHHQLLNKNFSHLTTVLIIYLIDMLFAAASIIYVLHDQKLGYIIYTVLTIIVITMILKTNIIVDQKNIRKK
ncbi:MAG: undecaprenyl/decaprenyl-phosphate alpha-N-acetylglucosaminyl 1-phosphate transferase [Bacilli bacterium]|nr:undecaprenyl/decaprenyl-phosphate alpha-N-acetylglucosaminyl 1-phosphate transferase [Bacilli bacterium]MBR3209015.1 undecaprenyl/decaprenyl-phosphate alpha-N-acetylglucosaminyl 1-phosphate transferase [Bacilli bacterium]